MTTSMHAPYLAPGEPGWGRVVRARARCSFSTAAPDMLESGACEACASLDGRSTHRRSDFASFALMDDLSGILGSDSETGEMQAKCRMKLSYPSAAWVPAATAASSASLSKPRPASSRAVAGPEPRRDTITPALAP